MDVVADGAGRFAFQNLQAETYALDARLQVSGTYTGTRRTKFVIAASDSVTLVAQSLGRVQALLEMPGGAAFTGSATIQVTPGGFELQRSQDATARATLSVPNGHIGWDGLADGTHGVVIAPSGFAWVALTAVVSDGSTADLGEILLERGRKLQGRVLDTKGEPVSGALVTAEEFDERRAETTADGRFSLAEVPSRSFECGVWKFGYFAVRVSSASLPQQAITLTKEVRVKVSRRGAKPRGWKLALECDRLPGVQAPLIFVEAESETPTMPGRCRLLWIRAGANGGQERRVVREWDSIEGDTVHFDVQGW